MLGQLIAACCLVGGSIHTPTGAPITQAQVTISGPQRVVTTSDAKGEFSLSIPPGRYALSVVALAGVGLMLGLGPAYAVGVAAVAILLAYEQHLVSPTDLSRVNMAFLNINGVIALLYLGAVSLDVALS